MLENLLKKAEDWLTKEYAQIHTGRASPAILDGVSVIAYGAPSSLSNVSSISIEDSRTLRVSPWDKGIIKDIEKAIQSSNLGLSVSTDDMGLRIFFPELTTERRIALVKVLKEKLEQARVMVKRAREEELDVLNKAEKDGSISEDEKFRKKESVGELVSKSNKKLEEIFEKLEKNIMEGNK